MTHQNDNAEIPPVVDIIEYEDPPRPEQRSWIQGTNLVILALAIIFVAIILIYVLTR